MKPSVHKGIILRKLPKGTPLVADLDPLWLKWRKRCSSDGECEQRVLLEVIEIQIADVIARLSADPPTLEPRTAYPLLAFYRELRVSANEALERFKRKIVSVPVVASTYGGQDRYLWEDSEGLPLPYTAADY